MLRHKPLVASLILAGVLAATDASALGLGRLSVTTALGQPLVAEVDLATSPGDDADSIRANVASPAVYRAANVEYQGVLQNVRAQVLKLFGRPATEVVGLDDSAFFDAATTAQGHSAALRPAACRYEKDPTKKACRQSRQGDPQAASRALFGAGNGF